MFIVSAIYTRIFDGQRNLDKNFRISQFGERLKEARKANNFSQGKLAEAINKVYGSNFSNRTVSNYENETSHPSLDILLILSKVLGYSVDYLISGEGKKYVQDNVQFNVKDTPNFQTKSTQKSEVAEPGNHYESFKRNVHKKLIDPAADIIQVPVNESGNPTIIQLDIQAAAGLPYHVNDPEYLKDKPAFNLPGEQYQRGEYFSIQVSGDSMEDTIYHGDWVICERVYDFNEVKDNYVHVVVTKEGVVTKRILNRVEKRGALALQSDNELYNTYDEPIENVLMVLRATGKFSAILKNRNAGLRKEVNELKDRIDQIEKRLPPGN